MTLLSDRLAYWVRSESSGDTYVEIVRLEM
jgi:hypothetical protein